MSEEKYAKVEKIADTALGKLIYSEWSGAILGAIAIGFVVFGVWIAS